jgi:cargo-transport protein YPP1
VDQMEGCERARLLQIKMTQLSLLELMEGAEAAVDVSHELLGMYARLFGNPEALRAPTQPPPTAASMAPPSRMGGTLRSIAGSIRPKSARTSLDRGANKHGSLLSLPEKREPPTSPQRDDANGSAIGVPIAITVTNEDGVPTEKSHEHRFPFKLRGHHGDWREHGNLRGAKSVESMQEKSLPKVEEQPPAPPPKDPEKTEAVQPAVEQTMASDSPTSPKQPLDNIAHNETHDAMPPPPGHEEQPPQQDVRLPAPHPASATSPEVRLGSALDRRYRISVLVDVWLFIAGLYLRADLLEDASGGISEAHKLVDSFEVEMAAEGANARRLYEKGWGGGKSVDELWADVWAAVSWTLPVLFGLY